MRRYIFIIITLLLSLGVIILNFKKSHSNFTNQLLNIYDEPLQTCKETNMTNGSWDSDGKCSELDGGVHQICIKQIAQNAKLFSEKTGQSDWSDKRRHNNHCVCLGAWSLYNAKLQSKTKKKDILKCEAIPKNAFSNNYISKFSEGWNKWNGHELNNQIKNGVESLMRNCYTKNDAKSIKLKSNYCNFAKHITSLNSSKLYKELC